MSLNGLQILWIFFGDCSSCFGRGERKNFCPFSPVTAEMARFSGGIPILGGKDPGVTGCGLIGGLVSANFRATFGVLWSFRDVRQGATGPNAGELHFKTGHMLLSKPRN